MKKTASSRVSEQWKAFGEILCLYWQAYGGFEAFVYSPYLALAIGLSLPLAPVWLTAGWWTDVIAAMPSLLGFSVAGLAALLAFGDDHFRQIQARAGGEVPTTVKVSSAFVHFIVVQCLALYMAFVSKSLDVFFHRPSWSRVLQEPEVAGMVGIFQGAVSWFSFVVFLYAICSALAVTLRIFRLSAIYAKVVRARNVPESSKEEASIPEEPKITP